MISVVIDISVTEVSKQYIYCLQVISNVSSLFNRSWRPRGGVQVQFYSFFNLSTRWGGWSTPCPTCPPPPNS